jgi:hypothetical protein
MTVQRATGVATQARLDVRLHFNPLFFSFKSSSTRRPFAGITEKYEYGLLNKVREDREAQSHAVRGGIRGSLEK